MDILYILGGKSDWFDNELRYSLRSIDTNGQNIGNVYLVGRKPPFISEKVRFLESKNDKTCAAHNMVAHITRAIDAFPELSEEFLLSSDDHFYVKPTDFGNYPYYRKGVLPDKASSGIYGDVKYTQCLVNTRRVLEALHLPTDNYAQHANCHINKSLWRRLAPVWKLAELLPYGVELTCVLYNALAAEGKTNFTPRKDCKLKGAENDMADLLRQIGDREIFSTYDYAIQYNIGELLKVMFPRKSPYEL